MMTRQVRVECADAAYRDGSRIHRVIQRLHEKSDADQALAGTDDPRREAGTRQE